ncbi:MAG: hypothetical protein J6B50_02385 [Lachnospiraceae bacterium]|nr:hypothetical protein [Lachnospiraceae bacterium]
MKRFLRNIRGSKLWRRTLALLMILAVTATLIPMDIKITKANAQTTIFNDTSITLSDLILKAVYKDSEGSHVVEMDQNQSYEFPYDADINMRLDFSIGNGNVLEVGKEYIYQLPSSIRVDVEADHQLADNVSGESIGTVHITKDGTLTFVFNEKVKNQTNVPFYVQFDGGLSEDMQEEGKSADLSFPTANGDFTIHVDTLGKGNTEDTPVIGAVDVTKEGTQIVNVDGRNYIEWTVSLGLNGRETLDGTIIDNLPAGLTYANVSGYPKVNNNSYGWGTPGIVDHSTGNQVNIQVTNCHPDYRTTVKFCTYYDDSVLPPSVNANSQAMVNNTVIFNPDDGTSGVSDDATVTIKPDIVSKSGGSVDADGNILWTVVINAENMDIQGTTFTDTYGTGLEYVDGSMQATNGVTPNQTGTGFTVSFESGTSFTDTVTITYKTKVTDYSQSTFKNTANLTGTNGSHAYNVTKEATVPGLNLISKSCANWNPVTHTFAWTITVNNEGRSLTGVQVTDSFDAAQMDFVSASMDGTPLTPSSLSGGNIVFQLGDISTTKVITVETKLSSNYMNTLMNDPLYNADNWYEYNNQAALISNLNLTTPITSTANKWVQVKEPDLLTKAGEFSKDNNHQALNDGTIRWTVTVNAPQLTVEGMEFSDLIPEDMKYVDGSFCIQNMYEWDDSKRVYLTPTTGTDGGTGKQTISFTFYASDDQVADFLTKQFQIVYLTKVTDYEKGMQDLSYTNQASLSVDYEGGVTVSDDVTSTVTGVAGGTLDKEYSYRAGNNYVDWVVTVNEACNDMRSISNPKIMDQLPDYFDYVSGTLYKDDNGSLTEVSSRDYMVSALNNQLIVQLPNIGSDCYVFKFRTKFNCLAAELEGKNVANTVSFVGSGVDYSKTSATVENISFSSSSAGSSIKREIRIKKVDSVTNAALKNAEFELWLGDSCIGTATSDASGYAVFEMTGASLDLTQGYIFKLKETQTPDGYERSTVPPTKANGDSYAMEADGTIVIDDCTEASLKTEADGRTKYFEIVIPNVSANNMHTGDIQLRKQTTTGYNLAGAKFGLYSDVSCLSSNLIATRTSDANGLITFSNMNLGTYYLKEMTPPAGYKVNPTVVTVNIADNSGNGAVDVTYSYGGNVDPTSCTLEDDKAVGTLNITKKDADEASIVLANAEFGLYKDALCTDRLTSERTDGNGVATFTNLELGRTYYYREDVAPDGYVLDNTVHSITIGDGTENDDVTKSITVTNQKAIGRIVIHKTDDSVPAKPLANVEFSLFDSTGNTAVNEPGTATPYVVTTDNTGTAVFENLPFGEYVVKETNGLAGYRVAADVPVTIDSLGDTEITVVNDAIIFNVAITKKDSVSSETLSGAVFGLYTPNGIRVKQGTTDANGQLNFTDIAYGNYYIQEIAAPDGYKTSDVKYTITTAEIDTNGTGHTFSFDITNDKENGSIKVTKVEEGTETLLQDAEFLLYDANHLIVKKADGSDYRVTTNASGIAKFEQLPYGTYYIEETQAPEGYIRDTNQYKVIVDSDTTVTKYVTEHGTQPLRIENKKLNTLAPFISFKIKKTDSATNANLQDAVFELYADGVGTGITIASDSQGMVYFRRISVSSYPATTQFSVKEVAAPNGYKLTNGVEIALGTRENSPYSDPDATPLADEQIRWAGSPTEALIENEQIFGSIWVTKTGPLSTLLLPGAEITLYESDGTTPVSGTGITNPVTTNANGIAVFSNLPVGTYYVKETKAPTGYTVNATPVKVVIASETVQQITIKDNPIQVSISKQMVGGTTELSGANLELHKGSLTGTVVDSWTTTDQIHKVPASVLEVNTTYYLVETKAPNGYGYASSIAFTIQADGSITTSGECRGQTIVMRDQPIELFISKIAMGGTNELLGATFALYDANQVEVERWISGTSAHQVSALVAPKTGYAEYTLRELSAPNGYLVAEDVQLAVAANGTVYTVTGTGATKTYQSITNHTIVVEDKVKPANTVYIRKVDAQTGMDLAGATFGIFDSNGHLDPLVTWTSNGRPHAFTVNGAVAESDSTIRPNTTYILRELSAPDGYVVASDIKFKINSSGEIQITNGNADCLNTSKDTISMRDNSISLKVRKQTGFGTLLPGATLRLSEYDAATQRIGATVGTDFTTNYTAPVEINGSLLKADQTYILQEITAPDGYQLANPIIFTIHSDGSITRGDGVTVYNNTIVMEDEEAGLSIGKVATDGQTPVIGATLEVTSVDDPFFTTQTWVSTGQNQTWDYLDFTPGCTYTLTELQAPSGYAYAEPIEFTIDAMSHQVYVNGVAMPNRTINMTDGALQLSVGKIDSFSKDAVSGAKLAILDRNGTQLATWTSGTDVASVDMSKVVAGNGYVRDLGTNPDALKEYILRETQAPIGYNTAADIHFAIDRDGTVYLVKDVNGTKNYTPTNRNTITMEDMSKFSVSKQDIAGEEVPGATLTITTTEDDSFQTITFVSGTVPKYFEEGTFKSGITYTLTETNAPNGYAYAESITFKFDASGTLYVNGKKKADRQAVMVDDAIAITISKRDITNSKELAGAKLIIKNETGEVIYSFISENTPTLIPADIFTAPKPGDLQYYSLTELTAPEGYEVAETIFFAIDSEGKIYVKNSEGNYEKLTEDAIVMFDQPSATSDTTVAKGPKTGDAMQLQLVIFLGLVSLFCGCVLLERSISKKS